MFNFSIISVSSIILFASICINIASPRGTSNLLVHAAETQNSSVLITRIKSDLLQIAPANPSTISSDSAHKGTPVKLLLPDFLIFDKKQAADTVSVSFAKQDSVPTKLFKSLESWVAKSGATISLTHRAEAIYDETLNQGREQIEKFDGLAVDSRDIPSLVEHSEALLPLKSLVAKNSKFGWTDYLPNLKRGLTDFKSEHYGIPISSQNPVLLIYRKDLFINNGFAAPPQTWRDFVTISKYFRSTEVTSKNSDIHTFESGDEGKFGACFGMNAFPHINFYSFLAPIFQVHGTHGSMFFNSDNMSSLFEQFPEEMLEAMAFFKEIAENSVGIENSNTNTPDNYDFVNEFSVNKNCAFGLASLDEIKRIAKNPNFNNHKDKFAIHFPPGSEIVARGNAEHQAMVGGFVDGGRLGGGGGGGPGGPGGGGKGGPGGPGGGEGNEFDYMMHCVNVL